MAALVEKQQSTGAARRRWPQRLAVLALLAAYPLFVLGYVYGYSLTSGLPGPRNGPQDAYRHVLASAVVAYTTSPRVVDWVTTIMEFSDDPSSVMDRHNNAIGAAIGVAAGSFAEIRPQAETRVRAGGVDTRDPQRVTWLAQRQWGAWPF